MRVRPGVELAGLSDVGCQRENNEDRYSYWEPANDPEFPMKGRLAIVADGMGGYEGGQEASRIAVEAIEEVYANGGAGEPAQPGFCRVSRRRTIASRNMPTSIPICTGWGPPAPRWPCSIISFISPTSGTAACTWCVVPPSHALRAITPTSAGWSRTAFSAPRRPNRIPSAISSPPRWERATASRPILPPQPVSLESGDVLVLCTDGLWGLLSESEIQAAVAGKTAAEICDTLVGTAKNRGGPDNITVQVLRVS